MNRFRRSYWALTGLLVAGLLSLPAWAAGSGSGFGFSVKAHGAFSYLQASDVNTGAGSFFDYYGILAEELGYATEGGYSPLHGGYGFGADLIFSVSPRLGVGIGVGYLRSSGNSTLIIDTGTETGQIIGMSKLSAMPIRLGLFTTWPLGGKLSLIANAGAAYYADVRFESMMRVESETSDYWLEMNVAAKTSRFGNVGFQGGLGLEYALSPRMFLFFEATGRYARFENFPSATMNLEDYEGVDFEETGRIYLETDTVPQGTLTHFLVLETEPVPDPGQTYREPKFDFSGFALQIGVRIRL